MTGSPAPGGGPLPDRPRVLLALAPQALAAAFPADVLHRLQDTAVVERSDGHGRLDSAARAQLARADVLVTGWGSQRVDAAVLDGAPRLRAVVHAAGTVKHLLDPVVWERGIVVSSAAEANARPVAEYTVAMITLGGKRMFRLADAYRRGHFAGQQYGAEVGNVGRTVGVVGASRVGRLVLRALAGHDGRLLLADPHTDGATARALGADLVDLDTLLRASEVVTLHAPLLPETVRLLDDRRLSLLRDGALLVNTARGRLVDTDALVRHCAAGRLDAVLDVTDPEPLPRGHPLLTLPGVVVTPHVAGAQGREVRRLGEFAVAEIERLARGQPLDGLVQARDLSRTA